MNKEKVAEKRNDKGNSGFKCKPKLSVLIEKANQAKRKLERSKHYGKFEKFDVQAFLNSFAEDSTEIKNDEQKFFVNTMKMISKKSLLVDYMNWQEIIGMYGEVFQKVNYEDYENYKMLEKIALYFESKRENKESDEIRMPDFQIKIVLADSGRFEIKLPELAEILNEVDGNRIRLCKICKNLFWSKRIDKKTCSAKCLQNFCVKNWLDRMPLEERSEYKKRRREYVKKQRKLKAEREKANESL